MNKYNYQDNLKRKKSYKLENKKKLRKSIIYNFYLNNSIRINTSNGFFNGNKDHSEVHLNNRCVLSGRKSKVNNLKVSRIYFRNLARSCFISGIRKSFW